MHGTITRPASEERFGAIGPLWAKRAKLAAGLLGSPAELVDLGCGAMSVRYFLPATTRYVGVDQCSRDADTIVLDLNVDRVPSLGIKTASMLGVLEYLRDVPAMLAQLHAEYDSVVLSYCHSHLLSSREKRAKFWRNHYTRRGFQALLRQAGFRIVDGRRLRFGEALYRLERA